MGKQPARLSDFQIPREGAEAIPSVQEPMAVAPEPSVPIQPLPTVQEPPIQPVAIAAPPASVAPYAIPTLKPRPVADPRQALTTRLPVSMHERMRVLMFASRITQQDLVESAIDAYLRANGA